MDRALSIVLLAAGIAGEFWRRTTALVQRFSGELGTVLAEAGSLAAEMARR
jgi:hypothetical protein